MSDLLVIAFPSPEEALRARAEFAGLQRDVVVEMGDVVVVTRGEDGRVQLHQAVPVTALGAAGGTLWGGPIGLLFLNPLLGAPMGAGALSGALADLGIPDDTLRELGGSLDGGGAALAVLLRRMTAERVIERLDGAGVRGRVTRTSLPGDVEARLRARLDGAAGAAEPPRRRARRPASGPRRRPDRRPRPRRPLARARRRHGARTPRRA